MLLIFNTSSDEDLNTLQTIAAPTEVRIFKEAIPLDIVDEEPEVISVYTDLPASTGDVAADRYNYLRLASEGVRYWGTQLGEDSILFAGDPHSLGFSYQHVIDDAVYTLSRKRYIESFGVRYTGRMYASPKTFIVVDERRKIDAHDPADNPKLGNFLASLPEDLWNSTALISSSSAKRLEFLLEEHDQTIPVATSTGTRSKISFMGLDSVESHLPAEPNQKFGINLRSSVTMFERD